MKFFNLLDTVSPDSARSVKCPRCNAKPDEDCRGTGLGRGDLHMVRYDAAKSSGGKGGGGGWTSGGKGGRSGGGWTSGR